jgi:membrane associated rhomboid family serine protease
MSHISLTSAERGRVKNIKINLVKAFKNKPIIFRVTLVSAGVVAGVFQVWFGSATTMNLSPLRTVLLLGTSTLIYAVLLTMYQFVQLLFQRGGS